MQFKYDALHDFRCRIFAISFHDTFHGEFFQVVSLQFDAVEAVYPSQFLYFFLGILFGHHHIAFLIAGEFIKQIFRRIFFAVFLFCSQFRWNGKNGHQRVRIQLIFFHFVRYLLSIGNCFRQIREEVYHFLCCLEPFLTGIAHSLRVINVFFCT